MSQGNFATSQQDNNYPQILADADAAHAGRLRKQAFFRRIQPDGDSAHASTGWRGGAPCFSRHYCGASRDELCFAGAAISIAKMVIVAAAVAKTFFLGVAVSKHFTPSMLNHPAALPLL